METIYLRVQFVKWLPDKIAAEIDVIDFINQQPLLLILKTTFYKKNRVVTVLENIFAKSDRRFGSSIIL